MLGRQARIIHFSDGSVYVEGVTGKSRLARIIQERGYYVLINTPQTNKLPSALLFVKRISKWDVLGGNRECDGLIVMSVDRTKDWLDQRVMPSDATERSGGTDLSIDGHPRMVRLLGAD